MRKYLGMEHGDIVRLCLGRGEIEHVLVQPVAYDQIMCQGETRGLHRMALAVVELSDLGVVKVRHFPLWFHLSAYM